MAEAHPLLAVSGASAGYGDRPVVAGVDIEMRRGDILGLMGANGSGKSTLLRAMTGQRPLLAGSVRIDGIDLAREPERAKAQLGLAVDGPDLPACLTGRQFIELVASLRAAVPDAPLLTEATRRLELAPWLNRPITTYSLGTRAKLSFVGALVGAAPLLIFDETLNGLDPVAAFQAKRLILERAATGDHAVIVATHAIETVPAFCNRALFLAEGRIVERWDAAGLAAASVTPGAFEACVMKAFEMRSRHLATR